MSSSVSSSSLEHAENGRSNKRKVKIFDSAASEDDPLLLKEPLLLLPTNINIAIPEQAPFQPERIVLPNTPPPPPRTTTTASPSFGLLNGKQEESSRNKKRLVQYETDNHLQVLFGWYGSVWPYVLPYCIIASLESYVIWYLKQDNIVDLTFSSSTGHQFMAIMVSFLVVTRANITYARFMEARKDLSECYRSSRELVQHACILTLQDDCTQAQEWRRNVAYRMIVLLRITMAAIEYRSSSINTWDVTDENLELLTPTTPAHRRIQSVMPSSQTPQNQRISKWAHGERTMADENFRAPIVLAYNLRETLLQQRNQDEMRTLHVNEELKLMGFVSDYISAFHGLKKLITTPFPFPLIQMSRTFLFFWVFSLPLVLVHAIDQPVQVMIIMFFICYGFLGLEYVSMELDDPFGEDPNDFDDLGMAEIVFEDIYITLFKRDGMESAEALRGRVVKREQRGDALQTFHDNFGDSLKASNLMGVVPSPSL